MEVYQFFASSKQTTTQVLNLHILT